MSERQLTRLLVVLCTLAGLLTAASAVRAFQPLRAGLNWALAHVQAASIWTVEHKPLQATWDWAVAHDVPQGWATLIGVLIGLSAIAWQARVGFRNLISSQTNQAELDRKALQERALLDREAREHQTELQAQSQEDLRCKETTVLAAAMRGELMAAAYQLSSRLIWLEGVHDILDELAKDPSNRFPTPFEIERVATPVYDANAPRLALIDTSLAADVAHVYAFLITEHKWTEPGGRDPKVFKALIETIQKANSVYLKDIVHVCKRLIAYELRKPEEDPGSLSETSREWDEPWNEPRTE